MPGDSKECRQRALRCTELAERATDFQLREILQALAQRWLELGLQLEHAQALRDDREQKLEKR
jgi:hypothetical protein